MNDFIGKAYRRARPIMVSVAGTVLVLAGIVMVALPGPGLAVIFAGLALLATEFSWARDLLAFLKRKLRNLKPEAAKGYRRRAEK